jgi:hypothetical protein
VRHQLGHVLRGVLGRALNRLDPEFGEAPLHRFGRLRVVERGVETQDSIPRRAAGRVQADARVVDEIREAGFGRRRHVGERGHSFDGKHREGLELA